MAHSIARIGDLKLTNGQTLPQVEVAYVAHGRLAPDGRNAILVTHGYTSGPSMLSSEHLTAEGSWAPVLGPGKALDTDRFFIVCSNMLGSSFGSTGPSSTNPATGKPWGPDFPAIHLRDIVAAQRALMAHLGVQHLQAVLGPSYGGFQALQWALDAPDFVSACGVIVSGFHSPGLTADSARAKFADHPDWHGGWHYGHAGMRARMLELRLQTLRQYGLDTLYADRLPNPADREAAMLKNAQPWADRFDPNSMVVLAQAAQDFDVHARLPELRARLLLAVCNTDVIFPPDAATRASLARVPAETRYLEIDSPYGHMSPGLSWPQLEPAVRWLIR
jgi:homoserine O-acetyltransferase/O-succinyltransferase